MAHFTYLLAFTMAACAGQIHAAPLAGRQVDFTGVQTGQGTFFTPGLGACGITNSDADLIAAASQALFDSDPDICGKTVNVNFGGNTVNVAITDRCSSCAATDLDFSSTAFSQLADVSVGLITGMTWTFA